MVLAIVSVSVFGLIHVSLSATGVGLGADGNYFYGYPDFRVSKTSTILFISICLLKVDP